MLDNENKNIDENNEEKQENIYEVKPQQINVNDENEHNKCTGDNCNCNDKVTFSKSFAAIFIDEIIIGIISVAVLFLVDMLMRLIAGYYVVEKNQMYLIVFVIVTLFYFAIMESRENRQTFGKKIMSLRITKAE